MKVAILLTNLRLSSNSILHFSESLCRTNSLNSLSFFSSFLFRRVSSMDANIPSRARCSRDLMGFLGKKKRREASGITRYWLKVVFIFFPSIPASHVFVDYFRKSSSFEGTYEGDVRKQVKNVSNTLRSLTLGKGGGVDDLLPVRSFPLGG